MVKQNESIGFLGALGTDLNPEGLLLAGVVIGSLGVLDDVTVTQISAVWELKRARPDADMADLYRRSQWLGEALQNLFGVGCEAGKQATGDERFCAVE